MTSNQRNWTVFFAAAGITAAASIGFLLLAGSTIENLLITLRLSARLAFVVLLVIFIARPLQQIFRSAFTAKLLRQRRLLGVAFAGIHFAHLGLIFYRMKVDDSFSFDLAESLGGMFIYTIIFLMFATSFNATARMLGPKNWRILHKVGLYIVFIAFVQTQLPPSLDELDNLNWPLVSLIAAAIIIRVSAYVVRSRTGDRA